MAIFPEVDLKFPPVPRSSPSHPPSSLSLAPGEGTALRAVALSALGQDAFGSLQAANQSLKTFKERCEICWCPFFGICFLRDDWVYLLIIVIICYLLIICWLLVDVCLIFVDIVNLFALVLYMSCRMRFVSRDCWNVAWRLIWNCPMWGLLGDFCRDCGWTPADLDFESVHCRWGRSHKSCPLGTSWFVVENEPIEISFISVVIAKSSWSSWIVTRVFRISWHNIKYCIYQTWSTHLSDSKCIIRAKRVPDPPFFSANGLQP